jgi:hypothetical protein
MTSLNYAEKHQGSSEEKTDVIYSKNLEIIYELKLFF